MSKWQTADTNSDVFPIRIKTPIKTEFAIKQAIKELRKARRILLKQIKALQNEQ